MRKLILSMSTSLDGYVEGKNGDMSWMKPDDDEQWDELFGLLSNVDLFLLGSGMWPDYRDYWKKALAKPADFSGTEVKYAKLAEKTQHIVFSATMQDAGWENTTIISDNAVDVVRKIKGQAGGDIQIVGGADFAATMLDSGLVDVCRVLINPTIIAGGKSFFHQLKNGHAMELIEARALKNQIVVLDYKQLDTKAEDNNQPKKCREENK